jgi:hypothetical protein
MSHVRHQKCSSHLGATRGTLERSGHRAGVGRAEGSIEPGGLQSQDPRTPPLELLVMWDTGNPSYLSHFRAKLSITAKNNNLEIAEYTWCVHEGAGWRGGEGERDCSHRRFGSWVRASLAHRGPSFIFLPSPEPSGLDGPSPT